MLGLHEVVESFAARRTLEVVLVVVALEHVEAHESCYAQIISSKKIHTLFSVINRVNQNIVELRTATRYRNVILLINGAEIPKSPVNT